MNHQGYLDVKRHINSENHQRLLKENMNNHLITNTFLIDKNYKSVSAEVKFTAFIAEHNLPIEVSSHASELFRTMFPDSEIAKSYHCGPTKTSSILNLALFPEACSSLLHIIQNDPFTLAVDGSSDQDMQKMFPLTVRVYDVNRGKVLSQFWDLCLVSNATALGIFTEINRSFERDRVPWFYCHGLSVDNAKVNLGKKKGLVTHFNAKNPSIVTVGCHCHIIHNCAQAASKALSNVSEFCIEDFLVDLFFHFEHSSKRKLLLKEFHDFCGQEYRNVVKYGSTRWLSLEKANNRACKQYESLKSYFLSQEDKKSDQRLMRLKKVFSDPTTEVYLLFYQSVLPIFNSLNVLLQNQSPQIHKISDEINSFLETLVGRFIDRNNCNSELEIYDFNPHENHLSNSELMIGFLTRNTIRSVNLELHVENKIFNSCREFFIRAYEYAVKHLPFGNELFLNAKFLNFSKRKEVSFSSIMYFVNQFLELKKRLSGHLDELYDEFISYKNLTDRIEFSNKDVDQLWTEIVKVINISHLFEVVKFVIILPHSNADIERVFSMIKKIKTDSRSNLSKTGTLKALLACKLNIFSLEPCFKFKPSQDVLKNAKKATTEYNNAHK